MEIKAAVAREVASAFRVEVLDLADPNDDEILVKIVATGICHTDLAIVDQILPLPLPYVLGHEGAGVVERVGANVRGFEPDDHVVLTFNSCGRCDPCTHEQSSYCDHYFPLNFSPRRADGSAVFHDANGEAVGGPFFSQSSFATYSLAQPRNTIKVLKSVPLELLGPLGCGLSTGAGTVMNVLQPGSKTTLAIFGTGTVGMAAIMAAKAMGVARIIAIDRVESRLNLSTDLGATETINTAEEDLATALANRGGIDQGIDTTGVSAVISTAADALKVRGTLVLIGASKDQQASFNIVPLISGRVIRGVTNGECDPKVFIGELIDLYLDGKFPMDRLVTYYSIDQINQAIADVHAGTTIKPVLRMG